MTEHLQTLIDARTRPMLPADWQAQRRSFAYGSTKIENDLITCEMVDQQDELLKNSLDRVLDALRERHHEKVFVRALESA